MMKGNSKKYFSILTEKLHKIIDRPVKFMEVCGTHTMAIGKAGIRRILPSEVDLISGPGCPVCVTADTDIDAFMHLAQQQNIILATYGDMIRVPGSVGSLSELKGEGADIRVVYSALEALEFARREKNKEVVFLGVGFETTAPGTAHAINIAKRENLNNFSVFNLHKTVPQVLKILLEDKTTQIDGFILPGHVSVIIGERAYRFLADEYRVPGAIAGFEPPEIMAAIVKLVQDVQKDTPNISNLYKHIVKPEGNVVAQKLLNETFLTCDAQWRGIGVIAGSGLELREEYASYDAVKRFAVERKDVELHPGCRCGEILKGTMKPSGCPLFGKRCSPESPVGPCMVSSEGTCAAYYLYDGGH